MSGEVGSTDLQITDEPTKARFAAYVDGELAGLANYRLEEGVIVFTHTEVAEEFEGHGVAGQLVRFALDRVREQGRLRVDPQCPYVAGWIEKHADYQDLLAI